ncbi:hypothetical protein RCH19_002049 [Flavobacterium sp. PL12]
MLANTLRSFSNSAVTKRLDKESSSTKLIYHLLEKFETKLCRKVRKQTKIWVL